MIDRTSININNGLLEKKAHPALKINAAKVKLNKAFRFFFIRHLVGYYIRIGNEIEQLKKIRE